MPMDYLFPFFLFFFFFPLTLKTSELDFKSISYVLNGEKMSILETNFDNFLSLI